MWLVLLIAVVLAAWIAIRRGIPARALRNVVERRLGGYRHEAIEVDTALPRRVDGPAPRVAVIGGGLAGIGAASALCERGVEVTLFERNDYLGGKAGAWRARIGETEQTIDHGFHAFFRQYYNLNRFLDRLDLRSGFRSIEDYIIIDADGRELSFGDIETAPGLNIVDLGRRGFYRWRQVMPKRTRDRLDAFVRFDMQHTYDALDDVPFARFCDEAALPAELRASFRTFARAFFSDEAHLSTADVLRAFHFYYLSHDHGLMYDFPVGDYEATLLSPIRRHLEEHGVELRLGSPVDAIERGAEKRFRVGDCEVDWVVVAADIPGAQSIIAGSAWMRDVAPEFVADVHALRTSHGYAVWRIWADRDLRPGLPTFTNVDRARILDSVTRYHRITDEAREWASAHEGAVLELHSYALPAEITDDAVVRRTFLEDLEHHFPEVSGLKISADVLQVRRDFPAFAPGQHKHRPEPKSAIDGMLMAGDWVRLPYPMTHMEAAFTSGLVCANTIFKQLGVQLEPIETVAPGGILPVRLASSARS